MEFTYRGQKENGELIKGNLEASDRFQLARLVRDQGAILVYAEPTEKQATLSRFNNFFGGRTSQKELMLFVGNLGALLAAGLTLSRALGVLSRQAKHASFRETIDAISRAISRGSSLHDALSAHPKSFPKVLVAMVAAGEESGTLSETLKLAAEQIKKSYELRRKIRGAMIYPAVIICVIIIIAVLMMIFLVPTLAATFKDLGAELPLSTRVIIGLSDFLVNFWYAVLIAAVAIISGVVVFFRRPFGRRLLDQLVLKIPVISSLAIKTNAGVAMRTIASLISSGVSMVETLRISAEVTKNSFYRDALIAAAEDVEKGLTLSVDFKNREDIFPPLAGELAEVGEETGELSAMLLRGALFYEDEVDQAVKNLSVIIEPVLMIIVGVAVGLFALAMIGPMYSLSNVI